MSPPESRRIAAALVRRAGPGADASLLADAVVALWRDIDAALTPILGSRGIAALHGRSLYLASYEFPWLKGSRDTGVLAEIDFELLRTVFVAQPVAIGQNGATAMFRCFHDLLASMVGVALTERLLHAVWDNPNGGEAAQDTAP
jgi:hypothetical protein